MKKIRHAENIVRNSELHRTDIFRRLGVVLDKKLIFVIHIHNLIGIGKTLKIYKEIVNNLHNLLSFRYACVCVWSPTCEGKSS
jgi:hypothetical protein